MARVPTAIKELRGSYRKNPGRRPEGEPVPVLGIGPAPSHFDPALARIWDEVVGMSYAGVLGEADRIGLETMCRLIKFMREEFEVMSGAQLAQLDGLIRQYGMTPVDRAKLVVPKAKPKNPYEGM